MNDIKASEEISASNTATSRKDVIVVSGSSGLIGTALIHKLAKKYQIVGLDNVGYPFPRPEAECVCVDITSDESMKNAFARIRYAYGNRIASVIHLAAYYSFSTKSSPLYEKITVKGTERLLRCLQDFQVEQFVFSSSMLVYKPSSPGQKIDEKWRLEPKWDYPKSKVATENLIGFNRGNIPAVNLRVAGVYNEEGNSIPVTNHIQRIYEKQITSYFFPGDPTHGSTFIHLDDLIDAIIKTVEARNELPVKLTLNIGEEETLSYNELQSIISRNINGKELEVIRIPKFLAKAGAWVQNLFGKAFIKPWMVDLADDHLDIDSSKAEYLLGWKPQHSLRQTLPEMIARLKADPGKFFKENKLKK